MPSLYGALILLPTFFKALFTSKNKAYTEQAGKAIQIAPFSFSFFLLAVFSLMHESAMSSCLNHQRSAHNFFLFFYNIDVNHKAIKFG